MDVYDTYFDSFPCILVCILNECFPFRLPSPVLLVQTCIWRFFPCIFVYTIVYFMYIVLSFGIFETWKITYPSLYSSTCIWCIFIIHISVYCCISVYTKTIYQCISALFCIFRFRLPCFIFPFNPEHQRLTRYDSRICKEGSPNGLGLVEHVQQTKRRDKISI